MATLTNAGLVALAKLANGTDSVDPFTYIGIGSGSTAEATSQTALVTESDYTDTVTGTREAATCAYEADYKTKWTTTVEFAGSEVVREVGIFSAVTSGTMLMRHVFAADKNMEDGDSLQLTIKMTAARPA